MIEYEELSDDFFSFIQHDTNNKGLSPSQNKEKEDDLSFQFIDSNTDDTYLHSNCDLQTQNNDKILINPEKNAKIENEQYSNDILIIENSTYKKQVFLSIKSVEPLIDYIEDVKLSIRQYIDPCSFKVENLYQLDFSSKKIVLGAYGIIAISNLIASHNRIGMLNLSFNEINDAETCFLFFELEMDKYLKELNLSNNYITKQSISNISECIEKNETLIELDLSFNDLSDIEPILKALSINKTLKKLNIANTNLNEDNISKIMDFLCSNIQLEYLNISYNIINDNILEKICNMLEKNIHLKCLDLSGNFLSENHKVYLEFMILKKKITINF